MANPWGTNSTRNGTNISRLAAYHEEIYQLPLKIKCLGSPFCNLFAIFQVFPYSRGSVSCVLTVFTTIYFQELAAESYSVKKMFKKSTLLKLISIHKSFQRFFLDYQNTFYPEQLFIATSKFLFSFDGTK